MNSYQAEMPSDVNGRYFVTSKPLSSLNVNFKFNPTRPLCTFVLPTFHNNRSFNSSFARMCRRYNELVMKHDRLDVFNGNKYVFRKSVMIMLSDQAGQSASK
jgi:hypothetical protein